MRNNEQLWTTDHADSFAAVGYCAIVHSKPDRMPTDETRRKGKQQTNREKKMLQSIEDNGRWIGWRELSAIDYAQRWMAIGHRTEFNEVESV